MNTPAVQLKVLGWSQATSLSKGSGITSPDWRILEAWLTGTDLQKALKELEGRFAPVGACHGHHTEGDEQKVMLSGGDQTEGASLATFVLCSLRVASWFFLLLLMVYEFMFYLIDA